MKIYIAKDKNGTIIGYVYFFTDSKIKLGQNRKQFIEDLIKDVKEIRGDYAGLYKKRDLEQVLKKFVFFRNNKVKKRSFKHLARFKFQQSKIIRVIKNTLIKCRRLFIPGAPAKIFIFPCFSDFVDKQQEGVCGFVPRQNVIHIYLSSNAVHFEKRLKYTVAHEFYHAISDKYCKKWNKSILGSLISEGLANNFRIMAVGGALTSGLIALSKKQCQKVWPKIKKALNSKDPKTFQELFFENKKYPLWSGYALGYQIVKSFLKKNPRIRWTDIVKLSPSEILSKSDFCP